MQYDGPVDCRLEVAEIQRRVYASGGPAVLFTQPTGSRHPVACNLFGSLDQARYLFRHTIERVRKLIELKIDPSRAAVRPWRYAGSALSAASMLPKKVRNGPVLANRISAVDLPQVKCWPRDGGAFVTLPQVLTLEPGRETLMAANLGMYRVQLSGGEYTPGEEVGLHYQIHRGIGVHHQAAIARNEPLPVTITVGGTPAMTLAAVMPLPEGLSELTFAGALSGRRVRVITGHAAPIYADADFAITGYVHPGRMKPEGPFGDHLGYYSLQHPFPVLTIESVWCRDDAIWPFTVVGRPPQEDTTFGELIHELTGPVIPTVLPGVKAVHAVDAAGVHPLLLAWGSERYMPGHSSDRPQELLTQANAILGNGQLSLAKYLLIGNQADAPELRLSQIDQFLQHMLRRVNWQRDCHFQTQTTIDTLDYAGEGLNRGSKLIIAAVGPPKRDLPVEMPSGCELPDGFSEARVVLPGVLAVRGPTAAGDSADSDYRQAIERFVKCFDAASPLNRFPLIVIVDDTAFVAADLNNFLWATFTRSNPAADVHGIEAGIVDKHWGCRGALVVDARIKPHHAPPLVEDPEVGRKVDAIASRGGPLARYL